MEASQPSHGTCRNQLKSAIVKEGRSVVAKKQVVLPVRALTAFGFAFAGRKQPCIL